jgi:rubrerythrin
MESRRDLAKLIEEQIGIERESVVRLTKTQEKVGSAAARLLLAEMRMDSEKHAGVLEAVLECLKEHSSSKSLWQRAFEGFADPILIKREIETHKSLGKSMLTHLQKEMSSTDDQAIRTLLGHLAQDERRHNEILDTIAKKCDKLIR